jgi:ribosome-associated protein
MIRITRSIHLEDDELHFRFVRASGPGGQNVNKVASAVQLRFDIRRSPSLPEEVRERAIRLARNRITDQGILVIEAKRFRTQERNRQDAIDRLVGLLQKAAQRPKPRRPTRPTAASKAKRRANKQHRSEVKKRRRSVDTGGD